jgi:hypothetical protein
MIAHHNALLHASAHPGSDWIAVFEDDARPFAHFWTTLAGAIDQNIQIINGDSRSVFDWYTSGKLGGGTALVLYHRSILERVTKYMKLDSDFVATLPLVYLDGDLRFAIATDWFLGAFCEKCTGCCRASMLVKQSCIGTGVSDMWLDM